MASPGTAKRSRIKGDGHCQFRAVAVHTYGSQQRWKQVRERAAEWVRTHWLVVAEDMTQRGVTLRSLLHRLQTSKDTVGPEHWGDENTALVVAWAYGRPLRVHSNGGADVVYLPDAVHEAGEIEVWYNGSNHYEAVRRTTNSVVNSRTKNNKRLPTDVTEITKKVLREHDTEHTRGRGPGDRTGNEGSDRHEIGQDERPAKTRRSGQEEAQQGEATGHSPETSRQHFSHFGPAQHSLRLLLETSLGKALPAVGSAGAGLVPLPISKRKDQPTTHLGSAPGRAAGPLGLRSTP